MRYRLIRKLKGCLLPVGTVSGELEYVMGIQVYRFQWTVPTRSSIPDNRGNEIPAWMCGAMPHYFRAVKGKSSNTWREGTRGDGHD